MKVTRVISFLCFVAVWSFHNTYAAWERNDYLSAFSTLSGLVFSVNSMLDGLKHAAVTLSLSNSADFNLINPKWYTLKDTTMDTPPPSTLTKDGTMVTTFRGPLLGVTTSILQGSRAFLTYEIQGKNKWIVFAWNYATQTKNFIVKIVDKDPFPSSGFESTWKALLGNPQKAGDYGTWIRDTYSISNEKYEVVYSMGAGSITPFQVFLAKKT